MERDHISGTAVNVRREGGSTCSSRATEEGLAQERERGGWEKPLIGP